MTEQLRKIRLIVLDVDGTLTDGGIYYDNHGNEFKKFSAKDGLGIVRAKQAGIQFLIITGRESEIVKKRADELKIDFVFQAVHDKAEFLKHFLLDNNFDVTTVAYIGDDLNDLEAMQMVGFRACPADAVAQIKAFCNIVLSRKGGDGAVREFIDLVSDAQNWTGNASKAIMQ